MAARVCRRCGQHPAIYIRRQQRAGRKAAIIVRAGEHHELCPRCWRSEWDAMQARALREAQ